MNSTSRQILSWGLAVFTFAAVVMMLTGLLLDRAADTSAPVDLVQSVLTVRHYASSWRVTDAYRVA